MKRLSKQRSLTARRTKYLDFQGRNDRMRSLLLALVSVWPLSYWLRPRSIPSPLPPVLPIGHLPSSGSCNLILSSPSLTSTLKMEAVNVLPKDSHSSIYQTTRGHNPEHYNQNNQNSEKKKPCPQLIPLLYSTALFNTPSLQKYIPLLHLPWTHPLIRLEWEFHWLQLNTQNKNVILRLYKNTAAKTDRWTDGALNTTQQKQDRMAMLFCRFIQLFHLKCT